MPGRNSSSLYNMPMTHCLCKFIQSHIRNEWPSLTGNRKALNSLSTLSNLKDDNIASVLSVSCSVLKTSSIFWLSIDLLRIYLSRSSNSSKCSPISNKLWKMSIIGFY